MPWDPRHLHESACHPGTDVQEAFKATTLPGNAPKLGRQLPGRAPRAWATEQREGAGESKAGAAQCHLRRAAPQGPLRQRAECRPGGPHKGEVCEEAEEAGRGKGSSS